MSNNSSVKLSEINRRKARASWADPAKRANLIAGIRKSRTKAGKSISKTIRNKWLNDTEWAKTRRTQLKNQANTPEKKQKKREVALKNMESANFIEAREATKHLPKKGEKTKRNSSNHSQAVNVKLRDPKGRVWEIRNLVKFVREHEHLFDAADVVWKGRLSCVCNATSALRTLWRRKNPVSVAKGWTLVRDAEVFYNTEQ
jgi:hypothetical protein